MAWFGPADDGEPERVAALVERDPDFGTDRLTSALMDFGRGHLTFTVSTQLVPYQRVQVLGTKARIEVLIPFNAPPDEPTRIYLDDGSALGDASRESEEFPVCDQYRIQGERFSAAVRGEGDLVLDLEDSIRNMAVIDATFRAALDRCAALCGELLPSPLLEVMFGGDSATIDATEYAQPAIFALEYALAEMWKARGVAPAYVLGHSVGEFAAAVVAGMMSVEDGMRLIAARGRLMQEMCEPGAGGMAAVFAAEAEVEAALRAPQ